MADYLLLLCPDPVSAVDCSVLLEREGIPVRVAVSEPQALALVRTQLPRLAVIDLDALDGGEQAWLGELERRFGHRPFPIILLSERADVAEEASRLYADGWLPKPIDPGGLMLLVRRTAALVTTSLNA